MINNNKKKKLRELLAMLSPDDEAKLLTKNLEDEIKKLEERISSTKDYSETLSKITKSIFTLRDFILEKIKDMPEKENIKEIEISTLEKVKEIKEELNSKIKDIGSDVLGLNSEIEGNKEELKKELKQVKKELDEWGSDLMRKVAERGGGSMNRQIKVAGVDVLNRYTDVNLIGSITTANDDANRRVNITFAGGGGTVTTDLTLEGDGSIGDPLGINLSNSNTWAASQTFRDITVFGGPTPTIQTLTVGADDVSSFIFSSGPMVFQGEGPLLVETPGFTSSASPITTGKTKGYITVPYNGTITGWSIGVDAGTATIKVWKRATGTAVPTIANVINTSGVSIASGTAVRSSTVSDFTTVAVAVGDILAFDITAISGVSEMTFQLEITKS